MPLLAWLTLLLLCAVRVDATAAQDQTGLREREPRFYAMAPGRREPQQIGATSRPILSRRIAVNFDNATLDHALRTIAKQAGFELAYSTAMVPPVRRVRLKAEEISVAGALSEVLRDLGVDVLFTGAQKAVLFRRGALPERGAVTGRITDAKSHAAIAGAEVFLAEVSGRASSDSNGWYTLAEVDAGSYTLTVRRFGYAKQSRKVVVREGQADTADVALEPVATRLDELVTTATGLRRRRDIANDVTTINADSVMKAAPIRSVTDLLEGRVPGLTVQHTSGAPGDPSRLRLRGAGSVLRNNDPIVVVDGIRVYAEQSANRSANLARQPTGGALASSGYDVAKDTSAGSGYTSATPSPLDYIDPNSIETIEVLKGPSATTQYGPDAANGVIVITTKKGRPGPARWSASFAQDRTRISGDYPELLVRWGHEIFAGNLAVCPVNNVAVGVIYAYQANSTPCLGDSTVSFQLLNDPALTVLDQGHRTNGSVTVSGGATGLTYSMTGSYADEVGIIRLPAYEADRYQSLFEMAPPAWMQRPQHTTQWMVRGSVQAQLGSAADIAFQSQLSRTEQQKSSLQDQLGTLMTRYLDQKTGRYYAMPGDLLPIGGTGSGFDQSQANILGGYYERATDGATQFTNGLTLDYRPRSWLTTQATVGLNVIQRVDELFLPYGLVGGLDSTGRVNDGQGRSVMGTAALRVNARRPLGRGFQWQVAFGVDYTSKSTNDVGVGTRVLAPGSSLQGSVLSFVRRAEASDATFGWYVDPSIGNPKFNVNLGLRLDRGSLYGQGLSGLNVPKFPKLGFTYSLSDNDWFPLKDLVSSLRVRLAYGRSNRQPGPTDRLRLYQTPAQQYVNGKFQPGVGLSSLGNTKVGPERTAEWEGGMDADFWDSRVTVTVSGYRKTTDDALMSVPVAPEIYGNDVTVTKNVGTIRNTGLDLTVGAQWVRSSLVTWTTNLVLSQDRNVMVRLGKGVEPFYTDPETGFNQSGLRVVAGYPVKGRWARPIVGYADDNGNGALEPSEVQLGDTAVYVGENAPNYTAAVSSTVQLWRGAVAINAQLLHDHGTAQRNTTAQGLALFSAGRQIPGTPLAEQVNTVNLTGTDYNWIQTASSTRLQSLSVQYRVPVRLARRLGMQQLSVAVQGSNLALWTNYRGLDPNVNAFGTGDNVTDTGVLPQPRTWQLQVNATF